MAGSEKSSDLEQILKQFFTRASEAEERLSRLEAVLVGKKGDSNVGDENLSLIVGLLSKQDISDTAKVEQTYETQAPKALQAHTAGIVRQTPGTVNLVEENSKLIAENTMLATENAKILTEKAKLETEIAKLKYQITHLVRALKEADCKLVSK